MCPDPSSSCKGCDSETTITHTRPARYGDIYRYRWYACMVVHFLDVNSIFEKRIIRTFGKCTRRSVQYSIAMSDVHAMVLRATEPGESAAGDAEISLINEAVTAVWNERQSRRERQTTIT